MTWILSNGNGAAFVAYTTLGYVALALDRLLFAPELARASTDAHVVLTLVNLGAGTWCFLRALRAAFARA